MKVCYLAHIRLPTEKAHGAQIMKTCEAFANAGASVTLVIPGRKTAIQSDAFSFYAAQQNFPLITLATPDFVAYGPLGFAVSLLWFSEAAKWRKEFWNADVIYSRDAFVLLQYMLLGRKLVYEAHMTPTLISRFVARRAYRVVAISAGLRDTYVQAGVPKERIVIAHDAVDMAPFQATYDRQQVRRELGIPVDARVALYVGKVDEAKGVPTLAQASEHVAPDIRIVIIGSGPQKEMLVKRYPKALFLPETPYRELPRILHVADVLVIPNSARDSDASRYTSPLKAFAYLASQKPIVSSDVPALREIFENDALFFTPDDPQDLARALADALGTPPRTLVKDYSWDGRARTILAAL